MYPNLYYAFKDLFDIDLPALKIVNTFGFFVAIAFLISAWVLSLELKRKQASGIFTYKETDITIGKTASFLELFTNFILGFVLGFKILGVFLTEGALNDPQSFILSKQGHLPAGILMGLFFAGLKWWEKNKNKLPKPEQRKIRIWPSDRVGDIVMISAISGFIGAKIFDNLENWDRFIQDPVGNLISPSGLTFYGGLIVATITLWVYFKNIGVRFINIADAAAPALMLAYGLGRIGCQVAGDGDWGILNSAFITNTTGVAIPATPHDFEKALNISSKFYYQQFGSLDNVQHLNVRPFLGLPDWLFAYSYPHNVNSEGIPIIGCDWADYCNHLPIPVFPTPLYEIILSILLFAVIWSVRKKFTTPGRIFAFYMILNGIERFFIEHIRVNTQYHFLGINPTQAEIISTLFILGGIALYVLAPKFKTAPIKQE